jgi:hypothetical protein
MIYQVVKFQDTGSVCLWWILIKWQYSWNYGCTNFKQCASCNSGMWLQEFSIAIGFIVLCVEGIIRSSLGCVSNGTFCTVSDYALLLWSGLLTMSCCCSFISMDLPLLIDYLWFTQTFHILHLSKWPCPCRLRWKCHKVMMVSYPVIHKA